MMEPFGEMHPDVKPLTKAERAWISRLNKVLLSCPTERLELVTIGDAGLTVIDGKVAHEKDLELHDGYAERNGVVLGYITGKPTVHAVSG